MTRTERNRQLYEQIMTEEFEKKNINDRLDFIIHQLNLIVELFRIEAKRQQISQRFDDMLGNPIQELEELFNLDNYRRKK